MRRVIGKLVRCLVHRSLFTQLKSQRAGVWCRLVSSSVCVGCIWDFIVCVVVLSCRDERKGGLRDSEHNVKCGERILLDPSFISDAI